MKVWEGGVSPKYKYKIWNRDNTTDYFPNIK